MKLVVLGAMAVAGLTSAPAAAQVKVVDQFDNDTTQPVNNDPNAPVATFVSNGITAVNQANGRVGQSFTPNLVALNFFTFDIANYGSATRNANGSIIFGPSIDTNLAVYLYSNTGSLLGISQPTFIAANMLRTTVQFDFTTPITLIPQQLYVTRIFDLTNLTNNSVEPGAAAFNCAPTYLRGASTISSASDLCFSEGISTAAVTGSVPEPATWGMLMLGFGGVGYTMRRKSKLASGIRHA